LTQNIARFCRWHRITVPHGFDPRATRVPLNILSECLLCASVAWFMMLRSIFDNRETRSIMSQSQPAVAQLSGIPLTTLSEDETMFRASVREFAEGEIRPRVEHMDEAAKLDPAIIKQCFGLGLMGIETPEEYGGAEANFFTAILAVEELSRVDASVGVFVDVQNTLVNNAFIRWGTPDQKKNYLTKLASESVGAYALSEPG